MALKLENPKNIGSSLAKLSKLFTVTSDGRVSWSAMELDRWTFILFNQLKFVPELDDEAKDSAIWSAINECAKKNDFSEAAFKRFILAEAKKLLSRAPRKYSVFAEFNYENHRPLPRAFQTPYGRIVLEKHLRKLDHKLLSGCAQHELRKYEFTFSRSIIRIDVVARTERHALHHGHKAIECCLGLLHLIHGGYGVTTFSTGPKVPIGKLLLTSGVLLIDRRKKEIGGWFMYSGFPERSAFFHQTNFLNIIQAPTYMRNWVAAIRVCDFSQLAKDAIVLFQQGLSALHGDLALLKFWTCIELICTPRNGRTTFERIVERASSIFPDPEASRLRLTAIKNMRDRIVHQGTSDSHVEVCAQWASSYAAALIQFSLHNSSYLRNHADILEYLSAGNSLEKIESKIRIHRLRKRQLKSSLGGR